MDDREGVDFKRVEDTEIIKTKLNSVCSPFHSLLCVYERALTMRMGLSFE